MCASMKIINFGLITATSLHQVSYYYSVFYSLFHRIIYGLCLTCRVGYAVYYLRYSDWSVEAAVPEVKQMVFVVLIGC